MGQPTPSQDPLLHDLPHRDPPAGTSTSEERSTRNLIKNAQQNEQVLRRYQSFELQLLDTRGLEELLAVLLQHGQAYFQLQAIELWLYDPDASLTSLANEAHAMFADLRILRDGRPLDRLYGLTPSVKLLSIFDTYPLPVFDDPKIRSAALLPLIRGGELVGSLHLGAASHRRFSRSKSTDFISHLASVVTLCIENAVNEERLRRLSMYDALTQVKNRRAFHESLEKEVSRSARSGDPVSLLFVDLDHFKAINDTYGHPMGDKVLREVAQLFRETLRKVDHVCRYGGEEFALILPNANERLAIDIAERVRAQVAHMTIENEEDVARLGREISVSLSIGACSWQPIGTVGDVAEADVARELVNRSDKGVYEAKAAGRNTVCLVRDS